MRHLLEGFAAPAPGRRKPPSKGRVEPLEAIEMAEGQEITVTILEVPTPSERVDALKATAGGWKDLIDAEELRRNIYADRLAGSRPEVRL